MHVDLTFNIMIIDTEYKEYYITTEEENCIRCPKINVSLCLKSYFKIMPGYQMATFPINIK